MQASYFYGAFFCTEICAYVSRSTATQGDEIGRQCRERTVVGNAGVAEMCIATEKINK